MDGEYIFLVMGMGAVTYLPRLLPLLLLTRRDLSPWFVDWLDFIPAAVLGALVLPQIITPGGAGQITLFQPQLLAAIPTFLVAWKTKSLAITVLTGMACFWSLEKFFF